MNQCKDTDQTKDKMLIRADSVSFLTLFPKTSHPIVKLKGGGCAQQSQTRQVLKPFQPRHFTDHAKYVQT